MLPAKQAFPYELNEIWGRKKAFSQSGSVECPFFSSTIFLASDVNAKTPSRSPKFPSAHLGTLAMQANGNEAPDCTIQYNTKKN